MKTMFLFFSLMATDLSTPYNIANVKETFSFNKTSKNFQLKRHISENVLVQKASRITSTKEIDKQVKEMEQYLKLDDISEPKNLMLVLVPTTDSTQLKSTTGSSSQWSGQNGMQCIDPSSPASTQPIFNWSTIYSIPDSKVHGANKGPTWVLSAPDGPHELCYQGSLVIIHLQHRYIMYMAWIGNHIIRALFQYKDGILPV